jgi:hypothetical protein
MAKYLHVYGEADCKAKGGLNNANEGKCDPRIKKGDINRKGDQSVCLGIYARQRTVQKIRFAGKRDERKRVIILRRPPQVLLMWSWRQSVRPDMVRNERKKKSQNCSL